MARCYAPPVPGPPMPPPPPAALRPLVAGWASIMWQAIDSTPEGLAPVKGNSPMLGVYFVAFVVFGSFLALNLFVGMARRMGLGPLGGGDCVLSQINKGPTGRLFRSFDASAPLRALDTASGSAVQRPPNRRQRVRRRKPRTKVGSRAVR